MKPSIIDHALFVVGITCALTPLISQAENSSPFGTREQPLVSATDQSDLKITAVPITAFLEKLLRLGQIGSPDQPQREELLAAFTAFQTQYIVNSLGAIVSAAPWTDNGLTKITVTLQQAPQEGLYLLGGDADHCIFIKANNPTLWTVGERISVLAYKTGEQEWTDFNSVVHKSALYQQITLPLSSIQQPAAPTREQFIAALRAGQTFVDLMPIKTKPGETMTTSAFMVQKLIW